MVTAFIEVLTDLWRFVTVKKPQGEVLRLQACTAPQKAVELLPARADLPATAEAVSSSILETKICYVQSERLLCLQTPHKKFDTLRGVLRYGDSVRVIQQKNHWSFVEHHSVQGWVETQFLSTDSATVLPDFHHNHRYDAYHSETTKLRLRIADELLGGELALDLQSTEYLLYRLKENGQSISWPLERPRLAGTWQTILKDKKGIAIGHTPKTGSVLECSVAGTHFLGYVETVTPESIIVISTVGRVVEGVFETIEYTKPQWQELSPVFISFT